MGVLRFFYATTLRQRDAIEHMHYANGGQIAGRADGR